MKLQLFWVCAALTVMGVSCHMNLPFFGGGHKSACDDAANPCSDGRTCFHGRCRTPCNDTDDCTKGKKCGDDGFCARDKEGCDLHIMKFHEIRCNATKPCKEGASCVEGVCKLTCSDDTACPPWKVCQSGVCQKKPECDAATPCFGGMHCVNATCLWACPNGDSDCDPWNECNAAGLCAPKEDDSRFNYDDWFKCDASAAVSTCKEGRHCVNGKCSRPCAADSDCKSFFGRGHKVCSNGFCAKAANNATDDEDDGMVKKHCHNDTECSQPGTECIEGKCRLTCSAASKCPDDLFCDIHSSASVNALVSPATVTGVCRKKRGHGRGHELFPRRCAEMFLRRRHHEQHCDATKPCHPDFDCVGGVCLAKCQNNTCKFGRECGVDGFCHRLNFTCSADSDCSGNRTCVDGICRMACDQSHACPQKMVCKENFCRFEGFFGLASHLSCDASNTTCPANSGRVCIDGWCRVACSADKPCAHNKVCSKDGYCTRNFHDDDHDDDDDDDNKGKDADHEDKHDEGKEEDDDHDD